MKTSATYDGNPIRLGITMRFNLRTLILVTAILAAWFAMLEFSPLLAAFVLATMVMYSVLVPVLLIIMGLLAAPQRETQLDVGALPYFNALARAWIWCLVLSLIFYAMIAFRSGVMR